VKNANKYTISIKDNGAGMEPSEYKRIFKKFYRVQNGNVHNTKGLGLGLYFTKKVIDGHHGKIEVQSLPGIGTEFKIELPLKK
jgi:two-component system phosphate regulon sensor histidine kinase PhoR